MKLPTLAKGLLTVTFSAYYFMFADSGLLVCINSVITFVKVTEIDEYPLSGA